MGTSCSTSKYFKESSASEKPACTAPVGNDREAGQHNAPVDHDVNRAVPDHADVHIIDKEQGKTKEDGKKTSLKKLLVKVAIAAASQKSASKSEHPYESGGTGTSNSHTYPPAPFYGPLNQNGHMSSNTKHGHSSKEQQETQHVEHVSDDGASDRSSDGSSSDSSSADSSSDSSSGSSSEYEDGN